MEFELLYHYQGEDRTFSLPQGEIVIGRKEYCDLCLIDGGVSKRHSRVICKGDQVEIQDAGSRNGTLVNGELIDRIAINAGDVIQVGTIAITLIEKTRASHTSFIVEDDPFDEGKSLADKSGAPSASRAYNSKDSYALISGEEERVEQGKATARLTVFDSGDTNNYDCFPDRVVTIGTKEGNTIVLRGDGISRYHAEVYNDGSDWLVKDLGSRNGIFIKANGAKEAEKHDNHIVNKGDEIQIGTCRLRFETVKQNNLELSKLFKDPRAKPALATTVVVVILAILLVPTKGDPRSNQGGSGPLDYGQTLQAGVKAIQTKNFSKATQNFAALQKSYKDQKAPGLLLKITSKWPDQSNPIIFDWSEAYEFLRELQKESDRLPKFVRLWVDTEAERVGLNKDAFNYLKDGQLAFEKGDRASRQNRIMAAIKDYDESLGLFRSISPKSEFYKRSQDQIRILERRLYELHLKEANRHFSSGNAEWNDAMSMFDRAQTYTKNETELFRLRQKMKNCIRNYEDEKKYQRAVEIVQSRRWKRYSSALDLLLAVNPKSVIYDDAKAYVEWIRSDLKVRDATALYKKGDERCLKLMNEVLKVKVLGPAARRGVNQRRQLWNRIITAYNEGRAAYLQGSLGYKRSQLLLKIVLKEERDSKNFFRTRAKKMLDTMRSATRGNDRNLAIIGLKALKKENLADAISYFGQLRRSKTAPKKYIKAVSKYVEKLARERRWFYKAYWEVLLKRDLNRYQWAHDVFFLLKEYLPKSNSAKKDAKKYFDKIDKEIRLLGESLEKAKGS
jgi:pSer/pThr/pTyr-binding forkhead associated (FHA) protein